MPVGKTRRGLGGERLLVVCHEGRRHGGRAGGGCGRRRSARLCGAWCCSGRLLLRGGAHREQHEDSSRESGGERYGNGRDCRRPRLRETVCHCPTGREMIRRDARGKKISESSCHFEWPPSASTGAVIRAACAAIIFR